MLCVYSDDARIDLVWQVVGVEGGLLGERLSGAHQQAALRLLE